MLRFLTGLVEGELLHFKRIAAGLLMLVVAMVFALIAVLFAILSLYLWFSTFLPPWQAALLVAGILLAMCLFVWILARMRIIRPARKRYVRQIKMDSDANLLSSASQGQKLSVIATAVVIGVFFGRRISK
jgi:Putative Actinobacterial Holin-X, holin superfamily III